MGWQDDPIVGEKSPWETDAEAATPRPGIGSPRDFVSGVNRNIGGYIDAFIPWYNLMLPKSQEVQPLTQGMRDVGIDMDRPRSLLGMMGEYSFPGPGGVAKNAAQTAITATGGFLGRQVAPDSVLAEMAGALSPNALGALAREAPRYALVGDQAARDAFAQNAAKFEKHGGFVATPAQAGGSLLAQFIEKGLAPTPGGAVAAHEAGLRQQTAFAENVARDLSAVDSSPSSMGKAFREVDLEHLGAFRQKNNVLWGRAAAVFRDTPQDMPRIYGLDATRSKYNDIIKVTPEQDIVEAGLDSKIKKIGEFLDKYKSGVSVDGMRRMKDLAADLLDPGLDYKPRQAGIADNLYGAMVTDMQSAAKTLDDAMLAKGIKPKPGMSASEIMKDASAFHAAEMKRRALLPSNMKEMSDFDLGSWLSRETDANTLLVAKHNAGPARWEKIRGIKIGEMMLAPASKQTDVLKTSSESFLTKYQSIKDPAILDAWFGPKGSDYRDNVDAVMSVASDMRKSSQMLVNPSGSGAAGITGASLGAAGMAAMTGNVGLAGVIIGWMGGSYAGLKTWFNSPRLMKFLAGTVKDPPEALDRRIATLAVIKLHDPEERKARDEMVAALKAARQQQTPR